MFHSGTGLEHPILTWAGAESCMRWVWPGSDEQEGSQHKFAPHGIHQGKQDSCMVESEREVELARTRKPCRLYGKH